MNVKELKEELDKYPDHYIVVIDSLNSKRQEEAINTIRNSMIRITFFLEEITTAMEDLQNQLPEPTDISFLSELDRNTGSMRVKELLIRGKE